MHILRALGRVTARALSCSDACSSTGAVDAVTKAAIAAVKVTLTLEKRNPGDGHLTAAGV
jgi:hypothetical protein